MNTKKKILFLVTQSEFGGAQRFIYTLVTALRRRYTQNQFASQNTQTHADNQRESVNVGNQRPSAYPKGDNQRVSASTDNQRESAIDYEVVIAAGPEGNDANGLLFNLEKENFKVFPLKFLKRSISPITDLRGIFEIRKLIKKQNPDIVFLCSSKAGILGSIAASLVPKSYPLIPKIIYRIGGWTFNDPWPKWKKKLYLWLEKKTARFKDFIVNNSQLESEQARRLGIRPRKEIITIYNGIDVESLGFLTKEEARKEIFRGHTQNNQRESAHPEGQNPRVSAIIGTVANLYPAKGLEYLIEAANLIFKSLNLEPRTSNIKFVIIGEGEERDKLECSVKKYNLEGKIILVGSVPDAWKYLKAFDVFVLPSVKEGFPWTVIEAMATRVPVVATRVGAIPEIIEDKKNGILIEPGNPQAIADAIKEFLNDKKLREDLSKEAQRRVSEKFTLDKMVAEYIKLFDA